MPDVTSTLLAMYQTIVGGSTSREQASCEAEAARRVILSGVAIGPVGGITFPLNVVIGTLSVGTLTVTGTFSVPGTLTIGTLTVTGNATVGGTLGVTGATTISGLLTTSSLQCNGPLSVFGTLTAGAGLAVTGVANVSGNLTVGGLVTATNGFGIHQFAAPGTGVQGLGVQNTAVGATNAAQLALGTDAGATITVLSAYSSGWTSLAPNFANGSRLAALGAGGLALLANDPAGVIRCYTGGVAERLRIAATGEVLMNTVSTAVPGQLVIVTDGTVHYGIAIQNSNASNSMNYLFFTNSAGGVAGNIAQSGATGVSYGTTSDARLKTDRGIATDLAALRAVRVHDFLWTEDGVPDRGIFAQEVAPLFPRAVLPGTDEMTETGTLARPWMTDYSKFVPDLIVGWQQHDATLARLVRFLEVGAQGDDDVSGGDLVVDRGRLAGDSDGDDPPGDGQPIGGGDRRGFHRLRGHSPRIPPS